MAHLPAFESAEVATKEDVGRLNDRFDRVEDRFGRLDDRFDRIEDRLDAVNQRLDRFFLTQSAGLIAIVGTLIAAVLL